MNYNNATPVIRTVNYDRSGAVKSVSVAFQGLKVGPAGPKERLIHIRLAPDGAVTKVTGPNMPGVNYSRNASQKAEVLRRIALGYLEQVLERNVLLPAAEVPALAGA